MGKPKPTRICNPPELPKWFKREKYDRLKDDDAVAWYEQLYLRRQLADLREMIATSFPNRKTHYHYILDALRDDPILDVDETYPGIFIYEDLLRLKATKRELSGSLRAVSLIDMTTLVYITENTRPGEYQLAKATLEKRIPRTKGYDLAHAIPATRTVASCSGNSDHASRTLVIDLCAPDSVILDQFRSTLASMRTKGKTSIKPTYNTSSWSKMGLLPYLDLSFWEDEQNMKLTYKLMADSIAPYDLDCTVPEVDEEKVRRTLVKNAKSALSNDVLFALRATAARIQFE